MAVYSEKYQNFLKEMFDNPLVNELLDNYYWIAYGSIERAIMAELVICANSQARYAGNIQRLLDEIPPKTLANKLAQKVLDNDFVLLAIDMEENACWCDQCWSNYNAFNEHIGLHYKKLAEQVLSKTIQESEEQWAGTQSALPF